MIHLRLESLFFFTAAGAYFLSVLLYLANIRLPQLVKQAKFFTLAGFFAQTLFFIDRGLITGRMPAASLLEFIQLLSWGTVLIFLIMQRRHLIRGFGAPLLLTALLLMVYSGSINQNSQPLMPALQSYWLKLHVAAAILAYGSFALSFTAGVMLLLRVRLLTHKNKQYDEELERLMNNAIAFGFPFMTLVLITGAVWAEQVWGAWWSWDPKETWALITWLIYAIYLHGRLNQRWQGRQSAWMAVLGFGAVVFTLIGVTWLLPGLHSYY
ncbi:MAG: c-type cytochrome biogenesis protein CcsB [Firmicutes bacterium]|nr:c-type cytochrome biogenesis protein CcsB [Bacillota bacterium]